MPRLDAGGAELSAVEIAGAVARAGGRALVLAEPGRLVADVTAARLTKREFHDAIMQGGTLPVDLVRARLTRQPLSRDYQTAWRFYDAGR